MRILQIGSGSIGSRRIRDLLPYKDVSLSVLEERTDRQVPFELIGLTIV